MIRTAHRTLILLATTLGLAAATAAPAFALAGTNHCQPPTTTSTREGAPR